MPLVVSVNNISFQNAVLFLCVCVESLDNSFIIVNCYHNWAAIIVNDLHTLFYVWLLKTSKLFVRDL